MDPKPTKPTTQGAAGTTRGSRGAGTSATTTAGRSSGASPTRDSPSGSAGKTAASLRNRSATPAAGKQAGAAGGRGASSRGKASAVDVEGAATTTGVAPTRASRSTSSRASRATAGVEAPPGATATGARFEPTPRAATNAQSKAGSQAQARPAGGRGSRADTGSQHGGSQAGSGGIPFGEEAQSAFSRGWESAQDYVEEVVDRFELKRRMQENPYLMLGAAAAVGYILGGGRAMPVLFGAGVRAAVVPFARRELMGLWQAAVEGYRNVAEQGATRGGSAYGRS